MTHDELLAKIKGSSPHWLALRAVVELHKPNEDDKCPKCIEWIDPFGDFEKYSYPCPTIQAITEQLK